MSSGVETGIRHSLFVIAILLNMPKSFARTMETCHPTCLLTSQSIGTLPRATFALITVVLILEE